ncbi:hypothetical protein [Limnohabitans sp. DM1]|uniref:hypothetical protein n=1 Tax=Limnohabitans sp. DM1 TaxID=1597955 RepID=UPI000AEB118D|nr:hypothetical protein [Limnohabitans sp. DM1]
MKKISAVFIGLFVVLKRIAFLISVIAAGYPVGWFLLSIKNRPFIHEVDGLSIILGIIGVVIILVIIGLGIAVIEKLAHLGGWKKTGDERSIL